jgi:hypothetical protein
VSPDTASALLLSIRVAVLATLLNAVVGIPLAYLLGALRVEADGQALWRGQRVRPRLFRSDRARRWSGREVHDGERVNKKKVLTTFTFDTSRCMFCKLCVNSRQSVGQASTQAPQLTHSDSMNGSSMPGDTWRRARRIRRRRRSISVPVVSSRL